MEGDNYRTECHMDTRGSLVEERSWRIAGAAIAAMALSVFLSIVAQAPSSGWDGDDRRDTAALERFCFMCETLSFACVPVWILGLVRRSFEMPVSARTGRTAPWIALAGLLFLTVAAWQRFRQPYSGEVFDWRFFLKIFCGWFGPCWGYVFRP